MPALAEEALKWKMKSSRPQKRGGGGAVVAASFLVLSNLAATAALADVLYLDRLHLLLRIGILTRLLDVWGARPMKGRKAAFVLLPMKPCVALLIFPVFPYPFFFLGLFISLGLGPCAH